jgi:uncharacterized protein YidB (DUF937 family)
MGLFDSIAGNVLGSVLGGNQNGGSNPLGSLLGSIMGGASSEKEATSAIGSVINASGGLGGLVEKAKSMGMGDVVGSWIGKGENQPISADQATQLLGNEAVQGVASKFGLDLKQVAPLIAGMLPVIIDKLTPHGEIKPDEHSGDALTSAIGGLLQGGGLQSILGSVLGGQKPA